MSRDRVWPPLTVVVATAVAAVVVADVDSPLRSALVLAFALVCPGMALARLLGVVDPIAELALAVALSFALVAIVPGAMLYAGSWSPKLALLILIAITLIATVIDIRRRYGGLLETVKLR
jgi:uncharacterized membrane protein